MDMDSEEAKHIRDADFVLAGSWGDLLIVAILALLAVWAYEKFKPQIVQLEGVIASGI